MVTNDVRMLFEAYQKVKNEDLGLGPDAEASPGAGMQSVTAKIMKDKQDACPCNNHEEDEHEPSVETNVEMAKGQLYDAALHAASLYNAIGHLKELEPWVAAKITTAADYLNSIKHYLGHQNAESGVEVKTEDNEEIVSTIERNSQDLIDSLRAILSRESKESLGKVLYEVINLYEAKN